MHEYTGASVGALTLVKADDDSRPGSTSIVSFPVVSGTVYRIAVDGFNGALGSLGFQYGALACAYAVSPPSRSLNSTAQNSSVNVSAPGGCSCTAVSNSARLTVTSNASIFGNTTVGYSVAANPSTAARIGTVTVESQVHTVTQSGAACAYTLTPSSDTTEFGAGSGSFSVAVAGGCAWSAVSDAGWLIVTSGASGNGNGTVQYSVAANPAGSVRSASIAVGGQAFTVTQSAAAATWYPSQQKLQVAAAVGSGWQELVYNYDTGASSVSAYQEGPGFVSAALPLDEWIGIYHYDYGSGAFTQAQYKSKSAL